MPMGFVKKTRMLWHISKWFLSLSPCGKHEGIFPPWYSLWQSGRVPRGKIHKSVGVPLWLGRPWCLQLIQSEPPTIHQLQFRLSYPRTGSSEGFCSGKLLWVTVFNLFSSPIWWAMVFPVGFSVVGMEGSRSGRWKIGENNYRCESNIMVLTKGMIVIEQSLSKSKMCWVWIMGCALRVF